MWQDEEAYMKFLIDFGVEKSVVSEVFLKSRYHNQQKIHAAINVVNKLLKSLPPSLGEIPRHPFDIMRLRYGLYMDHGWKKFTLKEMGRIYCISGTMIDFNIKKIWQFLHKRENKRQLMELFYPPIQPLKNLGFEEKLNRSVDELELSVRSTNCLIQGNILTIEDLVQKREAQLLKMPNLGRNSLHEIRNALFEIELTLGMKLETYDADIK